MDLITFVKKVFASSQSLVKKAWALVENAGINDDVLAFAMKWVRAAESKYVDNAEKREWVVALLKAQLKLPESVARLAVELAVRLVKAELAKVGG